MKIEQREKWLKEKNIDYLSVYSYDNGDFKYEDEDGIEHLFRNNKEIAKGISVYSYDNGDYEYEDEDGILHKFNKDGDEIE